MWSDDSASMLMVNSNGKENGSAICRCIYIYIDIVFRVYGSGFRVGLQNSPYWLRFDV